MTTSPPSEPSSPPSVGAVQNGAASALHGLAKLLGSAAARSDSSSPLVGLAQSASRHTGALGHWLQEHEPAEVATEAKALVQRKPTALVAVAVAAGVLLRSVRRAGRRRGSS